MRKVLLKRLRREALDYLVVKTRQQLSRTRVLCISSSFVVLIVL